LDSCRLASSENVDTGQTRHQFLHEWQALLVFRRCVIKHRPVIDVIEKRCAIVRDGLGRN
jgi:hypothetical protein